MRLLFTSIYFLVSLCMMCQNDLHKNDPSLNLPTLDLMCRSMVGDECNVCAKADLINYISENTRYPLIAKDAGIEGTVYIKFKVDTQGFPVNVVVSQGTDPRLNKEALRVVKSLPQFYPATIDDRRVEFEWEIPIRFVINGNQANDNIYQDFISGNSISSMDNEIIRDDSGSNKALNNNIRIRMSDSVIDISKIAVIGKESTLCDGTIDDGQGISELVEGELLGIYGVVERKHLEEIINEQRLAMSGLLFEESDFAQAGCLAGAQGTVLASYGCLQGKTKLQIKLVDCSTSDLYWSATGVDVSEFDLLDALRNELK